MSIGTNLINVDSNAEHKTCPRAIEDEDVGENPISAAEEGKQCQMIATHYQRVECSKRRGHECLVNSASSGY